MMLAGLRLVPDLRLRATNVLSVTIEGVVFDCHGHSCVVHSRRAGSSHEVVGRRYKGRLRPHHRCKSPLTTRVDTTTGSVTFLRFVGFRFTIVLSCRILRYINNFSVSIHTTQDAMSFYWIHLP